MSEQAGGAVALVGGANLHADSNGERACKKESRSKSEHAQPTSVPEIGHSG
jgi:hypothetical protein